MNHTKTDQEILRIVQPHTHTKQFNFKTMELSELVKCAEELDINTHDKEVCLQIKDFSNHKHNHRETK